MSVAARRAPRQIRQRLWRLFASRVENTSETWRAPKTNHTTSARLGSVCHLIVVEVDATDQLCAVDACAARWFGCYSRGDYTLWLSCLVVRCYLYVHAYYVRQWALGAQCGNDCVVKVSLCAKCVCVFVCVGSPRISNQCALLSPWTANKVRTSTALHRTTSSLIIPTWWKHMVLYGGSVELLFVDTPSQRLGKQPSI